MHYVKSSVNILLLAYFCLLQTIRGTLDHYSITIDNFGVLHVHVCVKVRETRHHAQAEITFGALICGYPSDGCCHYTNFLLPMAGPC
jgi:hypothetical protein